MPRPPCPFVPKSNVHLLPGDFWAIPLSDGRFAAGRVLARQAFGKSDRMGIVVGLLDYVGEAPPTSETIAGSRVVALAKSRFEAIAETGGEVLGNRSLELDGIQPPAETFAVSEKSHVWGWRTILNHAEQQFVGGYKA